MMHQNAQHMKDNCTTSVILRPQQAPLTFSSGNVHVQLLFFFPHKFFPHYESRTICRKPKIEVSKRLACSAKTCYDFYKQSEFRNFRYEKFKGDKTCIAVAIVMSHDISLKFTPMWSRDIPKHSGHHVTDTPTKVDGVTIYTSIAM